jgi:peptidoglycan/xylan/chitin deacetylase (PgdA/CDA1 family)
MRNLVKPEAIILLYHRVIDLPSDPQGLCVSRRNFAEHLQLLRAWGRTIRMTMLSQALQHGKWGRRMVLITFDDGYADNLYNAKPLLERYDIPATVFVTTGYLGSKKEFWYDSLERIFLHSGPLPEVLRLKVNGFAMECELGSKPAGLDVACRNLKPWNVFRQDIPAIRHTLYRTLCEMLCTLPDAERREVLNNLAAWAGMDTINRATHRTLSSEELIRLADGGLIDIGSHTVSHPVLSSLSVALQAEEITRSKARVEELLGRPVDGFAYPFGGRSDYTEQTVVAVREAGFKWACSNFAGLVRRDTDPWQLPRFLVRDCDGEAFGRALNEWMDG